MAELTITNYTQWSTSAIRKAVRTAEKHFGLKWSRTIIVKSFRRGGMRGRGAYPADRLTNGRLERGYKGSYEGQLVKLYLPPKPPQENFAQFERDFLWLVLHEVAHNAGKSHRDMGRTPLNKVWGLAEKPLAMAKLSIQWDGRVAAQPASVVEPKPVPQLVAA
jgi:hypothetical protein